MLLNEKDPESCARPKVDAHPIDPVVVAGAAGNSPDISVLDRTDRFCDDASCFAVVGGIPVYYEADHLNLEYARMLRPQIEDTADALPAAAG